MSERREQSAVEAWSPSAARERLRRMLAIARRKVGDRKPVAAHVRQARLLLDAIDGTGAHAGAVDSPETFAAFMASLLSVDPKLAAYRAEMRRARVEAHALEELRRGVRVR